MNTNKPNSIFNVPTFGIDLDDFNGEENYKSPTYPTNVKIAVHKCVIQNTWIEGQPVTGFDVPKNCIKAKATLHDVRLNPMNCELQGLFLIRMLISQKEECEFKGWL